MIQRLLPAAAVALAIALIGCSNDEVFPTTAVFPAVNPQSLDANAGTWRMIFANDPATYNVPAPDAATSANYQAELASIKSAQAAVNASQNDAVKFWSGGGSLRWNELMRGYAARFALPPAPLPNDTYPAPSATNPFADPMFPFSNPPYSTRAYSYLTVAQYDALKIAWFYKFQYNRLSPARNDSGIRQLVPIGDLPSYPSEDGVLAGVSSAILTVMFPVAAAEIAQHAANEQTFATISGKATASDVAAGFALGRTVAAQFLARAGNDGFRNAGGTPAAFQGLVDATVARGETPWRSLEVPPRPAQLPFFGRVTPWMLSQADIIANRPAPPPSTTSDAFRQEVAEVKNAVENITRDQLATVYKWSDGVGTYSPSGHWNTIAADYLTKAGFSEVRNARTFALLNTAEYDAIIGCWDAKYAYMLPRPSQVDPGIRTVVGLPNFPAYTSGHSSFSAAAASVLSFLFPAGTAYFNSQRDEAALSRLLGGIHYRSDIEVGKVHGARLAEFTLNFARTDGAN